VRRRIAGAGSDSAGRWSLCVRSFQVLALGYGTCETLRAFIVLIAPASDHEAEMENTGDFARYLTAAEGSGGLQQISEVRRKGRKGV
jgi:hypothetical protein